MTSSSSNSEPVRLVARGASVLAHGNPILSAVELCLVAGELVVLLGPSGAGKSTLLKALAGLIDVKGKIDRVGFGDHLGYVPQDDVLHTSLTVERTLTYAAKLRLAADLPEVRRDHRVQEVLAEVGLTDRKKVRIRNLSGGQRKRVSMALELLAKPRVMFMDEPTSGLDPALEAKSMALFRKITGPDRLTVVSTHVLASLEEVDVAVMLCRGRVVFLGPPHEAPAFFEVSDLGAVYRVLAVGNPEDFRRRFERSTWYRDFVRTRLG